MVFNGGTKYVSLLDVLDSRTYIEYFVLISFSDTEQFVPTYLVEILFSSMSHHLEHRSAVLAYGETFVEGRALS